MCARNDIDKKNMEITKNIIKRYPKELEGYINSLSRKTSFTKMAYARYVGNFIDYINNKLNGIVYADIKPMDIDSYMESIRYSSNGKEKSATYRAAQLAAINGFFKFLQKNNIINVNPCDTTEIPKDNNEHQITTISDKDLETIINNIEHGTGSDKAKATQEKWINRDIAIVMLGLTTGLRVSAIAGIDINDINMTQKYIVVTEKGDIRKKIYFGDKTKKALKNWIFDRNHMVDKNEKALFISQGNHRILTRTIQNRFKAITYNINKKITPHKMRATCATRLYEQTGDIYLVQTQLGHKNIENTKRYAKVSDDKKREAANILNDIF